MSFDVTFGVCLLLVARSLNIFAAGSSLAHADVMGYQGMRHMIAHGEMFGVGVLVVIGVALIALTAAKQAPMNRVAG